ncbi:hypothetical protein [Nocardia ignorata]|nr:hypothetical protein [Nocardia ignorata]
MVYESAHRVGCCDQCGAEALSVVSETVHAGTFGWAIEGSCSECEHIRHASGEGISAEVRAAIIADNGPSGLRIVDRDPSVGAMMRVIRSRESLPLHELRAAAEDLVANGRAGTLAEMSLLRELLEDQGVRAEVVFATPRRSGRTISLVKRVVYLVPPKRLSDPDTRTALVPHRLAEAEAELLAGYLESATVLAIAASRVPDRLTGRLLLPLGVMTDGEWAWNLDWADYVRAYRVDPSQQFRDHARSRNYAPVELDDDRVQQIARTLGVRG